MSRCHRCGWVVWGLWCVNPKCKEAAVPHSSLSQVVDA